MKHIFIKKAVQLSLKVRCYTAVYCILILTISIVRVFDNTVSREKLPLIFRSKSLLKMRGWQNRSILVLEKTGLLEDLFAVARQDKNEFPPLIIIPRFFINILAEFYLSASQQNDFLTPVEYNEREHQNYRDMLQQVIPRVANRFGTTLVISANYTYCNERDIQEIAATNFLRVIVLYKESFMSEADSKNVIKLLSSSRPFTGSRILVYNKSEENRQISSLAVRKNQICVTGSARFDELIGEAKSQIHIGDATIVFFVHDFIPDGDIWYRDQERNKFRIESNEEINKGLAIFLRAADLFPQLNFLIKTKVTVATMKYVKEQLDPYQLPPNLELILGNGLAHGVLSNCVGALGFNTTALIDAVAVGARIARLDTAKEKNGGGASGSQNKEYLIDYQGVASTIWNYESFESWLMEIVGGVSSSGFIKRQISPDGKELLEGTVGNSDGKAAKRVLNELKSVDRDILYG